MTAPDRPVMTAERWRDVNQILQHALTCTRDERDAVVANSCGGDAGLRSEVSSLLAAYDKTPQDFLERPAMEEHGESLPSAPPNPSVSAAAPRSTRTISARVAVYAAATAILLGTVTGWQMAHSATVDRWRATLKAVRQQANANGTDNSHAQPTGRISPHKHWIAYASNESGRDEVYVDSYPQPGLRTRISQGGGVDPTWRDDGRELYYWRGDALIAIPIDGSQGGRPPILGDERVMLVRQR